MPRPRKNQKKDVHLRCRRPIYSRFELLPHDIILKIFNECNLDSRCPELLRLSHQLLPVSLEAFYSKVDLFSTPQYVKFYAAIRHRPRLGEWVRLLVVSANKHCLHWRIPEDLNMELDPKVSAVASRKLAKVKKEEQKKKSKGIEKWLPLSNGEFDPSLFVFCGELFRDIFLRLPNLTNLYLRGQALTSCLFHCDDTLLRKLLPRLRIANFYPRAEEEEDYSLEDRLLCSRLSRLGRLETVTFQRNHDNQPFVESNQPASSISLPPGSWNLEDLKLVKMRRIGDLRTLFQSFGSSLRSIHLDSVGYYSTLVDNLLYLPRTLQSLFALYRLTNLTNLILVGPVVSSDVYSALCRLEKLTFLALDLHVPLDGVEILSLISGPRQLPFLNRIHVNICHCPVEGIRRPRWTLEFTLKHASKCLREMKKRGIEAEGNWKCAARFCDRKDGHDCSMSLPPIL
ncbi:hypothetical protein JCM5353_004242 [Sporobolomyces roseus]